MFRFTIREILLLTVIAAMAVGWWMEHQKLDAIQEELAASELQREAAKVSNDHFREVLHSMIK